ncbi:tryptamine hydroxycinnamoyltransferase 1-like [Ananas comosus]|uniref:Tryptamine hydroxycinnamoyltransferase 1-like n=1 Tax=Ananas comosus TaxID=4615 RepID=A0A6P5H0H6_ANACO|nr:tryptamine hydroxycinnamoyltransferase 1-like [Ananas comosus]
MDVHILSSRVLRPSNPNSAPSEAPLTVFDRFASNIYIAVLFAFSPPTPPNDALIAGLSKTLLLFPTLAGRLDYSRRLRRPCLIVGGCGGGALVVEAAASSNLSDHLPLEVSPDFQLLHPSPASAVHVFQVQLNRFACGGLIIGATAHHRVADGQSMSIFFTAWAQTVRGAFVDRPPVYDQSWLKPRCPPHCEFNHWGLEFTPLNSSSVNQIDVDPSEITNMLIRYSADFIQKLRRKAEGKYTTFETLIGHLWRKITVARRLEDRVQTMVRVSVNGRTRLKPPVPNEFFGNLVLNAYPQATAKDLIDEGLPGAAMMIHEAIRRVDDRYIQSFIDFGELYGDEELVPVYDVDGNVLSPMLEVDSWLRFRFEDVDFGGGGALRAFLPTWVPFEGLVMVLPGFGEDGGIDVFVTLLEEHAKMLRQISHSLD